MLNTVPAASEALPKTKASFELRVVPRDTEIAELNIADIQELALSVRSLIYLTQLATRHFDDASPYAGIPQVALTAIDTTLNVAFDLSRELYSQLVELGPSQL